MNITIREHGTSEVDVTDRLDDETDVIIDAVLERRAFQRSVEDLSLKLSNLWGLFADIFGHLQPTKRVDIMVKTPEPIYHGEVDTESVRFDLNEEWVMLDSFSKTKIFWDVAKRTRIARAVGPGQEVKSHITVASLLAREITQERFVNIFNGFSIDPLYENRPIRFWAYMMEPIGNRGRYRDLDPRLTIEELLKAMAIYYNAEFFIDPVTGNFTMAKRNTIIREPAHEIDDLLLDDSEINVQLFDEDRVDYIGLTLPLTRPDAPAVTSIVSSEPGFDPGMYRWVVAYVFRNKELVVESPQGVPTDAIMIYPSTVSSSGPKTKNATLKIPIGQTGVSGRRLYRTRNGGIGNFYLVADIRDNTTEVYVDAVPNKALASQPPAIQDPGNIWFRYDETTGIWDTPIAEDPAGLNRPVGKTFEITPELRFVAKPYGTAASEIDLVSSATWRGKTTTFIRTKTPHNVTENNRVIISDTRCSPSIDGEHLVVGTRTPLDFYVDGIVPTTPGYGGIVQFPGNAELTESLAIAEHSLLDVFAFFGYETDLALFREQWIDLFLTKRKIKLSVKGIEYRIGDDVYWRKKRMPKTIPMNAHLLIKKARINLTKERTELELLTL